MNEKNYDYLKNSVKFTGFGEELSKELYAKMSTGEKDFSLIHNAKFGNDATTTVLYFKKSNETDNYFFNSFDISLKKQNEEAINQTFYMGKENNVTLKEAYNLLSGRAIHKELNKLEKQGERWVATDEKYNAWVQLDFKQTDKNGNYATKQFHDGYKFDLEKAVAKHPIKELENIDSKSNLLRSLERGNVQSVTFVIDGQEQKRFIEANPQFWKVNVYDHNMQRLDVKQTARESQTQAQSQAQSDGVTKATNKQAAETEDSPQQQAAKPRKKRSQKVS
ncbi:hypothetical protein [Mucilaginibacter defluvii]